ncbi:MAG: response regulator, partial [Lutibacter sp.]|nr:response regulator [Lutibacter sp.]
MPKEFTKFEISHFLWNGIESMNPILLIFDNSRFAELIRFVLTTAGLKIELLADPLEIFEKVKEMNPPLIVMDIFLKNIDGLYLLERLYSVKE